jgi:hypothetical protein
VKGVEIGPGAENHRVGYDLGGVKGEVLCRWLVDASGGASLLKRAMNLKQDVDHEVSAAWFRLEAELKVDDWSASPEWKQRHGTGPERRFSVNHLMGKGYWVWYIPLATGSTSIGIVADENIHPVESYNSFEKALDWLRRYEPQCAAVLEEAGATRQDFGALKKYSRRCSRVFSSDRWFITGVAGVFVDPFYSPGSDFIAYCNTFITDMITAERTGEPGVDQKIEVLNQFFLGLSDAYFEIFRGKYQVFGVSCRSRSAGTGPPTGRTTPSYSVTGCMAPCRSSPRPTGCSRGSRA